LALKSIELPTAFDRLLLARTYSVDHWVLPALSALCKRTRPITLKEARQMGIEDVVLVATVREEIRRKKRPFVDTAEIQRLIEAAQVRMVANVASDDFTPDVTPDVSENEAAKEVHMYTGSVCERGPPGSPRPGGTPLGAPRPNGARPGAPSGAPTNASPGAPPGAPSGTLPITPPGAPSGALPITPPGAPPSAPADDSPEVEREGDGGQDEGLVGWGFPTKKKKKGGRAGSPAPVSGQPVGSPATGRARNTSWWVAPPA